MEKSMLGMLVEAAWQMFAYFTHSMHLSRPPYTPHNTSSRYTATIAI
jgi:hypothetical protein